MVKVERTSPLTGNVNKMYLDITQEQIAEWNAPAKERRLIQDIFPNLSVDEREFIMTGYTPADWKEMEKAFEE
tara:strand:- start:293 stop:511 length:219 start_codon:yes stop_codon:yes gene_type:complete